MDTAYFAATSVVGIVYWLITRLAQKAFRNLPPGPKGLPILGDLRHIADHDWLASPQRRDEYGEMMYVHALGQGILVINSQRVAIDLLEKRSNIYSDRQHPISGGDCSTKNLILPLMPYGDLWRRFRRVAVEGFSQSVVHHFHPILGREAIVLALALIKSPSNLEDHLQRHAWSILLSINYHLPPVESENDPAVTGVAKHVERVSHELKPGSRLVKLFARTKYILSRIAKWKRNAESEFVQDWPMFDGLLGKVANDFFTWMRYIQSRIAKWRQDAENEFVQDSPMFEGHLGKVANDFFAWMTYILSRFAKWKRDAVYGFVQDSLMFEGLLCNVANDLARGIDRPSFGATVITHPSTHDLSEREQAWLVGSMLAPGGDTTSTTLSWWLLAMLAYPEAQKKAQAELDDVVGRARPPTFADLPSLPYIRAMVKETLRWSPSIPFGMPHASTEDDVYEGMFIPKGTICLQNMRLLNFDKKAYGSNASEFDPGRYLDEMGQVKVLMEDREEGHMAFGFGRRVCPGRFIAEGTLGIDLATLLWAMRFERPEGARGKLDVRTIVDSGITAHPRPFEYKAIPRVLEAEALLNETLSLYGEVAPAMS